MVKPLRLIFSALFLSACSNDTVIETKSNAAPTIIIVSHSDGVEVQDGYVEYFRATVSDDDNEFDELQVGWYVGEDQICDWTVATPAGESLCEIVFEEGDENVIAEVRDTQGSGGRSEIAVTVLPTEVPVAEILSPVPGGAYYSDQLIQFSALVSDVEDDLADLVVVWSSSLQGELSVDTTVNSNGELSDYTYLTEGNHAIELLVEDTSGKFSTAEVVIQVGAQNNTPFCQIDEPLDGTSVIVGDTVTFRGLAEDLDIPSNQLTVQWLSDKDGVFGTSIPTSGGNVTYAYSGLSANTHTISMNVTDEVGAVCTEQILLEVGNPPTVTIDEPLDGALIEYGTSVLFRATVSDSEDQPGSLQTSWESNIDGPLQSGTANSQGVAQFSTATLSTGTHTIAISVTDSSGLNSDDLVTLQVNSLPSVDAIAFTPDPIYSNVNLTAVPTYSDPDGHSVTGTFEWFEDGISQPLLVGSTVPSANLDVGEVWTVRVTPNDGLMDGALLEESITVQNSIPVVSSVSISPTSGVYNDTFVSCSAVASDIDQTVTPVYTWDVGGVVYTGSQLDLGTTAAMPGDVGVCTATVTDAQGAIDSSTAMISVENRLPTVGSVIITPSTNVSTQSSVSCSASSTDLDGEVPTMTYAWEIGGQVVGTSSTLDLQTVSVDPGDTLDCIATATDGLSGSATMSGSVVVDNTPPTIDTLEITPVAPSATDTLTCVATSSDVDGGTPALTFAFSEVTTGTSFPSTSSSTSDATLDLSTLQLTGGAEVECTVLATDIDGGSTSDSTSVIIGNSMPVLSAVTITPNPNVYTGDVLTCSVTATDLDDGILTPTYQWEVNGTIVSASNTYTVSANDTNVGNTIECVASATDSDGQTVSDSASVLVQNTSPVLSGAPVVSANQIEVGQTVTCSGSGVDVDGQSTTLTYLWKDQNGSTIGSGDVFTVNGLSVGDTFYCDLSISDSLSSTSLQSTTIQVLNTVPTITAALITPNNGLTTSSLLTCSATATDANDGSLAVTYAWTATNGATHTGATWQLTSSIVSTVDSITCVASATDNNGATATSTPYVVTLNNSAPTVSNVSVTPNSGVTTGTTLQCSANGNDPDDGSLTPTYDWSVNGGSIGTSSSYTVSAVDTNVGDVIVCTASVVDSDGQSASNSASVTLQNSAPSLNGQPTLSRLQAEIGDTVVCNATGSDVDGDAVSLSYQWLDSIDNVLGSSNSYVVQNLSVGETIRCRVSITDGVSSGASLESSTAMVINSAPVISNAVISPSSGLTTSSLLTCSATATDANDGSLAVTYAWTATNGATHTGATWQLTSSLVSPSESISCVASATDANGSSTSSPSVTVTLSNSAPTVSNVTISPSSGVVTGSALTCSATGSDPDDGSLTPAYVWTVNGSTVGTGSTYSVSASDTNVGDSVLCIATVTDSGGQTATANTSVMVQNSAPTVSSGPILSSLQVEIGDTLTCTASGCRCGWRCGISVLCLDGFKWKQSYNGQLAAGFQYLCWGDDRLYGYPIRWNGFRFFEYIECSDRSE